MVVFYTASYSQKVVLQSNYDTIISTLEQNNCTVISLEKGGYEKLIPRRVLNRLSKDKVHYEYLQRAIQQSHATVIEATSNSFQLGHEATLSLLYNKPVLCLSMIKDHSNVIKHPLFKAAQYKSINEVPELVSAFLKRYQNKFLTVRLNLNLSPEQKNFLESIKVRTGKSASEYIRMLIDKDSKTIGKF